jgi:hypothetical protein
MPLGFFLFCHSVTPLFAQEFFRARTTGAELPTAFAYDRQRDALHRGRAEETSLVVRVAGERFDFVGATITDSRSLRLAHPKEAFWEDVPLESFLRTYTDPTVVLEYEPAFLQADPRHHGFLFSESRLLQWPPASDQVVLSFLPEGEIVALKGKEFPPALLTLEDGTALPIGNLNTFPVDSNTTNTLVLLTGMGSRRGALSDRFAPGVLAAVLEPRNPYPLEGNGFLWDATLDDAWRVLRFSSSGNLRKLNIQNSSLVLMFDPAAHPELAAAVEAKRTVRVNFPLPSDVVFAHASTSIGVGANGSDELKNVVFFHAEKPELEFYTPKNPVTPALGSRWWQELATRLKTDSWFDLGHPHPYLFSKKWDAKGVEGLRVRRALVISPGSDGLLLGGIPDLAEVRPTRITAGGYSPLPGLEPVVLFDRLPAGKEKHLEELYWSAPIRENPDQLPWVEMEFAEPVFLKFIDLVHAETAGFSPEYNLRGVRLLTRVGTRDPWVENLIHTGEEPKARERLRLHSSGTDPVAVRALRIEVTEPAFLDSVRSVRLAEILLWGRAKS